MIGLMGGTFSPIHYGHLLICDSIREEFNLGKIIFMPAKRPPHKDMAKIAVADDRLEMVRLAIEDNPFFEVSDLEMKRAGASYTVDTLRALKEQYGPNQEIGLIVGADSLVQIETWKSYLDIFKLAVIIVSSRPDTDELLLNDTIIKFQEKYEAKIAKSSEKAFDYASSDIRERVRNGLSIKYRVPLRVEEYIKKKGLYQIG